MGELRDTKISPPPGLKTDNHTPLLKAFYNLLQDIMGMWLLRGCCTSNQKLACFVLYLKIISPFLKNNVRILQEIAQGTQK